MLADRDAILAATQRLLGDARRRADIFSRDLDRPIYGNPQVVEALKQLVLRSHRAEVRILCHDALPAVRDGHRLIQLARRVTSNMGIRNPAPDHRETPAVFMIVDDRHMIYREHGERYAGVLYERGGTETAKASRFFADAWEQARPDPEIRQFRL